MKDSAFFLGDGLSLRYVCTPLGGHFSFAHPFGTMPRADFGQLGEFYDYVVQMSGYETPLLEAIPVLRLQSSSTPLFL